MAKTLAACAVFLTLGSALAWQLPWREYPGQDNIEIPPDYQVKTEWVFARLMYPPYIGSIRAEASAGRIPGATGSMADPVGPPTTPRPIGMLRSRFAG